MLTILLATDTPSNFKALEAALAAKNLSCSHARTTGEILSAMDNAAPDLLITSENLPDMTGRKLVETIIMKNPMIHCVICSDRSPDDFHETYEGMGVLMQLPPIPGSTDAAAVIDHVDRIHRIYTPSSKPDKGTFQ